MRTVPAALVFLIATAPISAAAQAPDDGTAVLLRALKSKWNVHSTMLQRRTMGEYTILVKVQVVPNFGISSRVLSPMSMNSILSFDDGKEWRTLNSDDNSLRIERSPALHAVPHDKLAELLKRNYRVSLLDSAKVAKRQTFVVRLSPLAQALPSRTLFIDKEKYAILRYQLDTAEGSRTVIDTQWVSFDPGLSAADLDMVVGSNVRVKRAWGPKEVRNFREAEELAGFRPTSPKRLPFGFATGKVHLVGRREQPFIAVRISDGIAHVTVYQWSAGAGGFNPFPKRKSLVNLSQIHILAVGDVGSKVLKLIEKAFGEPSDREHGAPRNFWMAAERSN